MANDLFLMDTAALQKQFAEIEKKLTTIDRDLRNGIMDNVLKEAALSLYANLSSRAALLSIMLYSAGICRRVS